ncbi:unnamed protein product [Rotaria socialis]
MKVSTHVHQFLHLKFDLVILDLDCMLIITMKHFDELHDAVHMAFEDLGGSNQLIYKLDLLLPSPLINYNQPQIK